MSKSGRCEHWANDAVKAKLVPNLIPKVNVYTAHMTSSATYFSFELEIVIVPSGDELHKFPDGFTPRIAEGVGE